MFLGAKSEKGHYVGTVFPYPSQGMARRQQREEVWIRGTSQGRSVGQPRGKEGSSFHSPPLPGRSWFHWAMKCLPN